MNRDVVEGNSTSLESSACFPDPQEPPALMDFSQLHMNDLGLTPSPGFQPQGVSQDEEQNFFTSGGRDGIEHTNNEGSDMLLSQDEQIFQQPEAQENIPGDTNDLYDPLFDSASPELESIFSRKRNAEELEVSSPEKRQHLEFLDETPSLTTDSTHQSPASFFDTFDSLFGGGFDFPLELPGDTLPEFEEITLPTPPSTESLTSKSTEKRFLLNEQDLIANSTREVLQVPINTDYISPYPVSGGPLGYLPSAPGIHVKYVTPEEEHKDRQIASLRAQVDQLNRERNRNKRLLSDYSAIDSSGKTSIEVLREENAMLRRVSTRHQARVEQYKKEATDWKNKLHVLGVTHNNLLYEIRVEKRIPDIDPAPEGYKPPRLPRSLQGQLNGHHAVGTTSGRNTQNTAEESRSMEQSRAVTIDLTEDEPIETSTNNSPIPPTAPPPNEAGRMNLRTLRSKNYNWLQAADKSPAIRPSQTPAIQDDELARLMERELMQV
ncbi:hypothetical protein BJX99DRAFT_46919 [Aspergillus californicus]